MQSRRQPRKEKRQSRAFLKTKKGYLLEGWICTTIEAVRTERGVVDFLLLLLLLQHKERRIKRKVED
jgi:hypothetical protein